MQKGEYAGTGSRLHYWITACITSFTGLLPRAAVALVDDLLLDHRDDVYLSLVRADHFGGGLLVLCCRYLHHVVVAAERERERERVRERARASATSRARARASERECVCVRERERQREREREREKWDSGKGIEIEEPLESARVIYILHIYRQLFFVTLQPNKKPELLALKLHPVLLSLGFVLGVCERNKLACPLV